MVSVVNGIFSRETDHVCVSIYKTLKSVIFVDKMFYSCSYGFSIRKSVIQCPKTHYAFLFCLSSIHADDMFGIFFFICVRIEYMSSGVLKLCATASFFFFYVRPFVV